jgi:hypothetical protein
VGYRKPRPATFGYPNTIWLGLLSCQESRVPHISLVFREMWDTTKLRQATSGSLDSHSGRTGAPRSPKRTWDEKDGRSPTIAFRWAYSETVVTSPLHSAARRIFPAGIAALLLILLVTQAASSVCSTQCLQRQMGTPSPGHNQAMADCHSMAQPVGPAVRSCPPKTYSICVVDLLANRQAKTVAPLSVHADQHPDTLLPTPNIVASAPADPGLRSSVGHPPLITPLRV